MNAPTRRATVPAMGQGSPQPPRFAGSDPHRGRPMSKRVVIAGGGVAALETALALKELADERIEVELVAPEPHFWYRPLSVAEPFGLGEAQHHELGALAAAAGATFTLAALDGVDVAGRQARTSVGDDPLRRAHGRGRGGPGGGGRRRTHLPRPGRQRRVPGAARGGRRGRSAAPRVRRPLGRGLVAAALRAGADDRRTSRGTPRSTGSSSSSSPPSTSR